MSEKDTNIPSSIVPTSIAQQIATLALNQPEMVYDTLVRAEKWLKEIKESARQVIIKRMKPETPRLEIETDSYSIHAVRNRPVIKGNAVQALCSLKGISSNTLVYKTISYDPLPTARDSLEQLLKSKIITQAEYDACFEAPKITVSVKPKSAGHIVSLDE